PNSFIGRERELRELDRLVRASRVLTLCGPGGIGKTRLALRLLASVAAAALGISEEPGRPLADTVADVLEPRRLLLALDTCEHLRGASRSFRRSTPGRRSPAAWPAWAGWPWTSARPSRPDGTSPAASSSARPPACGSASHAGSRPSPPWPASRSGSETAIALALETPPAATPPLETPSSAARYAPALTRAPLHGPDRPIHGS
ncbi:MAG TPA: hypothetical protein VFQ68_46185, partial [Streptosporangiaceae bacterium]|nr:hypothetical protein [Streptosporangiaceae bacterium]